MKLLITGGLGFIGSNLIRLVLAERPDWRVVNLDLDTYAANPENLEGVVPDPLGGGALDRRGTAPAGGGGATPNTGADAATRYRFVKGDVADRELVELIFREESLDAVIHCAAESHVDRSIEDGAGFLRTNVEGTLTLLEAARAVTRGHTAAGANARAHAIARARPLRFMHMSTDEVYGTLAPDDPPFTERTPLAPRSPYSASKAAADHLALAFHHTHGLDTIVTRCSNNYGPYQHPEKLIPLMITSALEGRPLPVYGDGRQRRDWIHVEDHCRGVLAALERGRPGRVYNFGADAERENLEVVHRVIQLVGASEELVEYVTDRPGHDRRYAMAFERAERELDWRPSRTFEEGLEATVAWYREHEGWWRRAAELAYAESEARIAGWAAS